MDVDSDSEAEQVAQEFAQAQEQLWITNEARERCQEEQKQKEEEEKEQQRIAVIEAEELLEMECQYQLQVSTRVLRNSTCTNFVAQKDLEASVMTPEPLLAPFIDKGKEVSTGINFWNLTPELKSGTGGPFRNQWGPVL